MNQTLTPEIALTILTNPLTWLPALAYLTTFGFELALESNMANILFSIYKSPHFGQTKAGYVSSMDMNGKHWQLSDPLYIAYLYYWAAELCYPSTWRLSRRPHLSKIWGPWKEVFCPRVWHYPRCDEPSIRIIHRLEEEA